MTEAIVEGVGSTFVGGTSTSATTGNEDIDVLTFAAGITTANLDLSRVSGFETIDLGTVTTGGVLALTCSSQGIKAFCHLSE